MPVATSDQVGVDLMRAGLLRWVIFGISVTVQLIVLYWPRVQGTPSALPLDKIVHLTVFAAVMGAGLWVGLPPTPLAIVLIGHAAVSELVQHFLLVGRTGDVGDVVADVLGVALAVVLWRAIWRGRADVGPSGG